MEILPDEESDRLLDLVIKLGLDRDELLVGLSNEYISGFNRSKNSRLQLRSDLRRMNDDGERDGVRIPLSRWLESAAFTTSRPDDQKFFKELANKVASAVTAGKSTNWVEQALGRDEKILFRDERLPHAFLENGLTAARSVGYVTAALFRNGERTRATSFGTGWLIADDLLITCDHVACAGLGDEASPGDFQRQAASTTVEFGFDAEDTFEDRVTGLSLIHRNKLLDYAVLKLPRLPTGQREPLRLCPAGIKVTPDDPAAVNIVQHPERRPKQLAIRNNAVAAARDHDLAYFTDTSGGSSGSPVCNDDWEVVALHKQSNQSFGKLSYQGRETFWINVGTQIHHIIEDLRSKAPDVLARAAVK